MGWVVNATPRSLYPWERPGTQCGWAPGPVWTGAEYLASTGIRSPDRPARSELLHRLNYRGPPCSVDAGGMVGRGMNLTTHLNLVSRLRMSVAVHLHFVHTFVTWTAATWTLTPHKGSEGRDCWRTRRPDIPSISSVLLCIRQIMCIKIPDRTPYIMTVGFHGFYRLLHANTKIISQIRPRPLPFLSLRIHYVLIVLTFVTTQSEQMFLFGLYVPVFIQANWCCVPVQLSFFHSLLFTNWWTIELL